MGLFWRLHLSLISISISSSLTPEKVLHYYSRWPSKHKAPRECSQTLHVDKRHVPICMQPTDAAAFRLKCRNESSPESFPPPPVRCQLICEYLNVCVFFFFEVSLLFSPPVEESNQDTLRHHVLSLQPYLGYTVIYLIWNSDDKKRNVPAPVKHGTVL